MLALIRLMNQQFVTTPLWGLTSHYHLLLQNQAYDSATATWWVALIGNDAGYRIEFCRPKTKPLETTVLVRAHAFTTTEALAYIAVAMTESGGWPSNRETEQPREGVQMSNADWQIIPASLI